VIGASTPHADANGRFVDEDIDLEHATRPVGVFEFERAGAAVFEPADKHVGISHISPHTSAALRR